MLTYQDPDLDAVAAWVLAITEALAKSLQPNTEICPKDGCLIRARGRCPACDVRNSVHLVPARRPARQHDPRRPFRWVPIGGIKRAVYDQSEVA